MYLVKAKVPARAPDISGKPIDWVIGQKGFVSDADINQFRVNTAAWEILAGPDVVDALLAAVDEADNPTAGALPTVTGLIGIDKGIGQIHTTRLILSDVAIAVTDALAYASKKLYDFPAGRILILGVTGSLQFGVTTDRDTTINDSASLTWSLGSVAASNKTLDTTMVDLLPKATKVLDGVTTAYTTASTNALAASAQFDGTATAVDAYLNVGFETDTQIDANGTLKAAGTITLTWINLGDY